MEVASQQGIHPGVAMISLTEGPLHSCRSLVSQPNWLLSPHGPRTALGSQQNQKLQRGNGAGIHQEHETGAAQVCFIV